MIPLAHASDVKLLSPLMQLNNGTSTQNIACSDNLKLIYKSTNGYPACVTQQTSENLIKRGWGILQPVNYLINVSGILVHYNFTGGNIHDSKLDPTAESVYFSLNMTSSGMLNVTLPRALIDAKCNDRCDPKLQGTDVDFVVLNDKGQEVYSKEVKTTQINRTISIQISSDVKQIEITYTRII